MSKPAQSQRIAEVEYCLNSYFYTHFVPVMNAERDRLQHAQAQEVAEYTTSFAGIMQSMADPYGGMADTMTYLRYAGGECSKTAEDYVEMVRDRIAGDKDFQADLARLAGEWRNAVIADVGRERYDRISQKLGADLALAYIDYRIEQMMIDRMVAEKMPKSSMEYIIRKGAANCLLGLPQVVVQSPLEAEIEARGEAAYHPSTAERVAARGVSLVADVAATGGVYSWGAVGRLVGCEVVFAGLDSYLDSRDRQQGMSVDEIVSKALYGDSKALGNVRRDCWQINSWENNYILAFNNTLFRRMAVLTEKPAWETFQNPFTVGYSFGFSLTGNNSFGLFSSNSRQGIPTPVALGQEDNYRQWQAESASAARANVPLVVAPGHEQEYLAMQEEYRQQEATDNEAEEEIEVAEVPITTMQANDTAMAAQVASQEGDQQPTNESGWAGLLGSVGLSGLGDIGHNLGYVLAMLPDILFGTFTGSSKSLGLKDSLVPLASLVAGIFIKNPVLKMLLIGFGGVNLINKAGHEALERADGNAQSARYKQYADEPLNPRITNPQISCNTLVATIDRVPVSVTLPEKVVGAYQAGALPLNTLANAVLARCEQTRSVAQTQYENLDRSNTPQITLR